MSQQTEWRYEEGTKTIRSVPANRWIATMDSWDGAEDRAANAMLIAAAPQLRAALQAVRARINGEWDNPHLEAFGPLGNCNDDCLIIINAALVKAEA